MLFFKPVGGHWRCTNIQFFQKFYVLTWTNWSEKMGGIFCSKWCSCSKEGSSTFPKTLQEYTDFTNSAKLCDVWPSVRLRWNKYKVEFYWAVMLEDYLQWQRMEIFSLGDGWLVFCLVSLRGLIVSNKFWRERKNSFFVTFTGKILFFSFQRLKCFVYPCKLGQCDC